MLLTILCFMGVAAGTWLGVMENVLRHPGYFERSLIAACIVVQSMATLMVRKSGTHLVFRALVMSGAGGLLALGGFALVRNANARHFEGFVLIIGSALVLQGALTLVDNLTRYRARA